jgi:tetratricopeptide (TPR) repeat protein
MGCFDAAEALCRTLRDNLVGYCSPNDASLIAITHDLAACLGRHHKYEEAEGFFRQVVTAHEETSGPLDVVTLGALIDLAISLLNQEKWDEAAEIVNLAVQRFEPILGTTDHRILRLRGNQGLLLYRQGRFAQALELFKSVHVEYERHFGVQHPDFIQSLVVLSTHLRRQRKYSESLPYLQRGLAWCFEPKFAGNFQTTTCMSYFALALTSLNLPDAERVWIRLSEMYLSKDQDVRFADMIPEVISAADNEVDKGDLLFAEVLYEDAVQFILHLSDSDDPRLQPTGEKLKEVRRLLAMDASAVDQSASAIAQAEA